MFEKAETGYLHLLITGYNNSFISLLSSIALFVANQTYTEMLYCFIILFPRMHSFQLFLYELKN